MSQLYDDKTLDEKLAVLSNHDRNWVMAYINEQRKIAEYKGILWQRQGASLEG